jgi:hypothetical protein
MEKLIPEKKRYKTTINASTEDINSLYKISILAKLSLHFEKKLFNKEKEFEKDLHDLHQKTFKNVKCQWDASQNSSTDFTVYTTDNIKVELKSLMKSNGRTPSEVDDINKEIQNLCRKHDPMMLRIVPVLEKIIESYWR